MGGYGPLAPGTWAGSPSSTRQVTDVPTPDAHHLSSPGRGAGHLPHCLPARRPDPVRPRGTGGLPPVSGMCTHSPLVPALRSDGVSGRRSPPVSLCTSFGPRRHPAVDTECPPSSRPGWALRRQRNQGSWLILKRDVAPPFWVNPLIYKY